MTAITTLRGLSADRAAKTKPLIEELRTVLRDEATSRRMAGLQSSETTVRTRLGVRAASS